MTTTRLFNQGKPALKWDMGGRTWRCEAYGAVDMPDELVEHCTKRGLPLGLNQVAPEIKALVNLDEASVAARSDEVLALKHDLGVAQIALSSAKSDLENAVAHTKALETAVTARDHKVAELALQLKEVSADKLASEQLLAETAKQLAEAEQRATLAETALAEAKKSAKPESAPAKKP